MTFLNTQKIIYAALCTLFAISAWATTSEINHQELAIKTNADIALSSSRLIDKPFIFQAGSNKQTWSGSLKKKALSQQDDGRIKISNQAEWDAGKLLTEQQAPANRSIATYNYLNKRTVMFKLGELPDDIRSLFNLNPDTQITDDLGEQRIEYIKGNRAMESTQVTPIAAGFQVRQRVLGNVTHSTPVYAGAPAKHITDEDYSAFYEQHKTRPNAVFVSANDGMLHAFSADSGAELFAYIPSPLLKKLPQLTSSHSQYEIIMDGNSYVAEARVAGQWKTVLAAGIGSAAKGVFALDVSQPHEFMRGGRVLFEFTHSDDPDIGHITAAPFIAKIKTGMSKKGRSSYGYFVVVQSGYQDAADNAAHLGESFLFLLSLNKSPTSPWSKNSNYYKISVNSHNKSSPHTLSAPTFIVDKHGAISYGYAGDTQGNLWRLDYTGDNPLATSPKIIFSAKDSANHPQPINAQPVVSSAPDGGNLILFGTGKVKGAENDLTQNSFYAINDATQDNKDGVIKSRSELAQREFISTTMHGITSYKVHGKNFTYATSKTTKKGWYLDYLNKGQQKQSGNIVCQERSVSPATYGYKTIFFNTVVPSGRHCNQAETSISYRLNAITGLPDTPNLIGAVQQPEATISGAPILISTNTELGQRDSFGRRYNTQHYSVLNFGANHADDSSTAFDTHKAIIKAGRLSWREISNWQDLKAQQ